MIAILGGTFDPIHQGHMHIAARVLDRLPIEQLQFMPCAQPVHRNRPRASSRQRCEMIELEIADRPEFALNRIEIEREGPSYMIDSLREMHCRGLTRLALILGSDSFAAFASWKSPNEILQLAHLVVCRRPGNYSESDAFAACRVDSAEQLATRSAGAVLMLDVDAPDCASSRLREQIAEQKNPGDCLGSAVAEYIYRNGLYRSTFD